MLSDETPSLTVAVLTWQHAHYVEQCLESVRRSDFRGHDTQVVIFDNGSTDGTPEITGQFLIDNCLNWEFIRSPKNLGSKPALNELLSRARGTYFTWISGDDFVDAERYGIQIDAFLSSDYVLEMVAGSAIEVDESSSIIPGRKRIEVVNSETTIDLRELVFSSGKGVHVATQMVRTATLRAIGGWEPEIPFNDSQIDFKIALIPGAKVAVVPSAVTFYRIHPGMSSVELNSRHFVTLFTYFLTNDELTGEERRTVTGWLHQAQAQAQYEQRLSNFSGNSRWSRLQLLLAAGIPKLQMRSRINALLLALLPVGTRSLCRRKYRLAKPSPGLGGQSHEDLDRR